MSIKNETSIRDDLSHHLQIEACNSDSISDPPSPALRNILDTSYQATPPYLYSSNIDYGRVYEPPNANRIGTDREPNTTLSNCDNQGYTSLSGYDKDFLFLGNNKRAQQKFRRYKKTPRAAVEKSFEAAEINLPLFPVDQITPSCKKNIANTKTSDEHNNETEKIYSDYIPFSPYSEGPNIYCRNDKDIKRKSVRGEKNIRLVINYITIPFRFCWHVVYPFIELIFNLLLLVVSSSRYLYQIYLRKFNEKYIGKRVMYVVYQQDGDKKWYNTNILSKEDIENHPSTQIANLEVNHEIETKINLSFA